MDSYGFCGFKHFRRFFYSMGLLGLLGLLEGVLGFLALLERGLVHRSPTRATLRRGRRINFYCMDLRCQLFWWRDIPMRMIHSLGVGHRHFWSGWSFLTRHYTWIVYLRIFHVANLLRCCMTRRWRHQSVPHEWLLFIIHYPVPITHWLLF